MLSTDDQAQPATREGQGLAGDGGGSGMVDDTVELLWIRPWCRLQSQILDPHGIWIRIWFFFLGEPDP